MGFSILFAVPLAAIIREDFKYRAIHWIWLLVLLTLAVIGTDWVGHHFFRNITLVAIQLLGLTLYFSIKEKKIVGIINHYLGIGDVLFLIPLALLFSPVNFLFFLVGSLLFSMAFALSSKVMEAEKYPNIPLAGLQSICLLLLFLFKDLSGWNMHWQAINEFIPIYFS